MKKLLLLAVFPLLVAPALAAKPDDAHTGTVYLGYMRGGPILHVPNSPKLGDDFSIGIDWTNLLNEHWGYSLRLGYSPTNITHLAANDVSANLLYFDLSAVYQINYEKMALYVPAGLGWADLSLDRPLSSPLCPGSGCVKVDGDSGLTYHVGLGMAFDISKRMVIRTEGRVRVLTSPANALEKSAQTFEFTVGVGWTY